jgi:hypothetical protein
VIEEGQVRFEELVDAVHAQGRVWVHLRAVLKEDIWTALVYDLVAPVEPSGWRELAWLYPEAVPSPGVGRRSRNGPALAEFQWPPGKSPCRVFRVNPRTSR